MADHCIVTDCPVQARPAGCGYLTLGVPCRHPRHRTTWEARQNGRPGSLLRRIEAAQRTLTPERARQ